MHELDDAVNNHRDQSGDEHTPTDQGQGFGPSGSGLGLWRSSISALVAAVAEVAIGGRIVGAIVRRVVPCHGRRC